MKVRYTSTYLKKFSAAKLGIHAHHSLATTPRSVPFAYLAEEDEETLALSLRDCMGHKFGSSNLPWDWYMKWDESGEGRERAF